MKERQGRQTGLVFFPAFDWAISPTHPEREERLLYTRDQLLKKVSWIFPRFAVPAAAGRIKRYRAGAFLRARC